MNLVLWETLQELAFGVQHSRIQVVCVCACLLRIWCICGRDYIKWRSTNESQGLPPRRNCYGRLQTKPGLQLKDCPESVTPCQETALTALVARKAGWLAGTLPGFTTVWLLSFMDQSMDEIRLGVTDEICMGIVDDIMPSWMWRVLTNHFCHLDDRCLGRSPYFGEMRGRVPRLTKLIFINFRN